MDRQSVVTTRNTGLISDGERTTNWAKEYPMGFYEALLEPEFADANDDWTEAPESFEEFGSVLDQLRTGSPIRVSDSGRSLVRGQEPDAWNVPGHAPPR